MPDVTLILEKIQSGDQMATSELLPLVYTELRKIAAAQMARENAGHTLQSTALVHEAYVRLVDNDHEVSWDSRAHFFTAAAESMRRILIESARRKNSLKHGGELQRVPLTDVEIAVGDFNIDILALDDALEELAIVDPDKAQLVKLRYFAGLSVEDAAKALGISTPTAVRRWRHARAWLAGKLSEP